MWVIPHITWGNIPLACNILSVIQWDPELLDLEVHNTTFYSDCYDVHKMFSDCHHTKIVSIVADISSDLPRHYI